MFFRRLNGLHNAFLLAFCAVLLVGCSTLPSFGPNADDIVSAAQRRDEETNSVMPFDLINVDLTFQFQRVMLFAFEFGRLQKMGFLHLETKVEKNLNSSFQTKAKLKRLTLAQFW